MTFEEWFLAQPEWWHEETARESLSVTWEQMIACGLTGDQIGTFMEHVISVMRNEYGE